MPYVTRFVLAHLLFCGNWERVGNHYLLMGSSLMFGND